MNLEIWKPVKSRRNQGTRMEKAQDGRLAKCELVAFQCPCTRLTVALVGFECSDNPSCQLWFRCGLCPEAAPEVASGARCCVLHRPRQFFGCKRFLNGAEFPHSLFSGTYASSLQSRIRRRRRWMVVAFWHPDVGFRLLEALGSKASQRTYPISPTYTLICTPLTSVLLSVLCQTNLSVSPC